MLVATTGNAVAIASKIVFEISSLSEDKTNRFSLASIKVPRMNNVRPELAQNAPKPPGFEHPGQAVFKL